MIITEKKRVLSIDLETFSDVDLSSCGVYRYVEGDFHILLFAYTFDDEEVKIIDMAQGEQLPQEVIDAIFDDSIIKAAWNAQFERTCLSRYFGTQLSPDSWQCSMVWAASLSLPLKLKTAAEVLKTGEQKDDAGERLIKYFSVPCKPTKTNGGRTRNLPEHAPEDWKLFKSYCKQDVRTERDIRHKLEAFPLKDSEWDFYHLDQRINDRGVLIDKTLVEQAITCDLMLSDEMTKKAYELTGLENPNSVSQLKGWLTERGIEVNSLGKKDVAAMITDLDKHSIDTEAQDMLKLRLQMAKSSVKKYQAADRYVCKDGRAHGLFQFSGAQRTQRWCLTGDHEVLTQEGWVRMDEWDGSPIVCWNAQSEAVSYQKVKKLCFDYEGPMYTYTDKRIDQCSTPDHKMRVQKRYGAPWQDMTVEEMSKYRPCIPMNGYRYHRGCANPDWIKVLIMTQADGHYTVDGAVKFHFKKQRKIERCKSLLRRAGIAFVEHQYKDAVTIDIPARAVPLWLREFRSKTFGFWLLDENPDIFFDELPNWDGSRVTDNSIQYCTTNKQNADIVQALAHMSGRCCSVVLKHRPEHPEWADAYYLNIWLTPRNCHELRVKPVITEFAGKVYCAETSTGYFLVRRNGRVWVTGNSGRGIQLQNLPQNHISTLDEARELIKMGCFDMVESIYGNTPDILSQLIRTMLVPKDGCEFIVADFSAIEARVLAWEAGEQWVLDAFKNGEDLYCATASQMFHVPVVKHGVNGELRQKGKIATLACGYSGSTGALISMGALDMGLKEDELPEIIQSWRTANPKIVQFWWDIEKAAVETVKDHQERHVRRIGFQFYANTLWMVLPSGRKLAYIKPKLQPNRFGRMAITYEGLNQSNKWVRGETYSGKLVENCIAAGTEVLTDRGLVAIEDVRNDDLLWDGLEWVSHEGLIDKGFQNTVVVSTEGHEGIHMTANHRILTEEGWIRSGESAGLNWAKVRTPDGFGTLQASQIAQTSQASQATNGISVRPSECQERVYDIRNCGPRHRFCVFDRGAGELRIVSNCTQATARDILAEAMWRLEQAGLDIVGHVHDEVILEVPKGSITVDEVCAIMNQNPTWADGLPLDSDGYTGDYYFKS